MPSTPSPFATSPPSPSDLCGNDAANAPTPVYPVASPSAARLNVRREPSPNGTVGAPCRNTLATAAAPFLGDPPESCSLDGSRRASHWEEWVVPGAVARCGALRASLGRGIRRSSARRSCSSSWMISHDANMWACCWGSSAKRGEVGMGQRVAQPWNGCETHRFATRNPNAGKPHFPRVVSSGLVRSSYTVVHLPKVSLDHSSSLFLVTGTLCLLHCCSNEAVALQVPETRALQYLISEYLISGTLSCHKRIEPLTKPVAA